MYETLRFKANHWDQYDDCLQAVADHVAKHRGLVGWDLNPRWEDDERDVILVDVPKETDNVIASA